MDTRIGSIVYAAGRFQVVKTTTGYIVRHSKTRNTLAICKSAVEAEIEARGQFEANHFAQYAGGAKCLD